MSYKFNPFTGTFDWTAGPAGSNTQVQFNDGGNFGGASQVVYDKVQGLTGIQKATPTAPLHVAGVSGLQLPAPTTPTATLVEDVAITTPGSLSSNIKYGPAQPNTPSVTLIQIDYVTSASTSQNTGSGNYTANGQTIYYQLRCYRFVGGTIVTNYNAYSFSFTDTINDGTTAFTIDITGITPNATYYDGFILEKSYDGSTWSISADLGTTTYFNDNDFSGSVSFEVSQYQEYGNYWSASIANYESIGGTIYSGQYISNGSSDSNSGYNLIIQVDTYGTAAYDGFIIQQYNSYIRDIGTDTTYYDWGSSTGSMPQPTYFNDVAFPVFNTSLTGANFTYGTFNYGNGNFVADGSSWDVGVWAYRFHPETGEKWFTTYPNVYSLGADDNSSNLFGIDWSCYAGDGDGYFVVAYQNGWPVYETDVGNNVSGTLLGDSSSISTKPDIATYTGISRTFTLYGYVVSPTDKYSIGSVTTSFSDSNLAPYFIHHSMSTPGNATNYKIIETSYRNGSVYASTITSDFYQTLNSVGDTIHTPTTVGYLANGSNLNRTYTIFSRGNSYGTTYYSSTGVSVQTTDPNNSKYYTVNLTWLGPGVSGWKVRRTTGATSVYQTIFSTNLADTVTSNWGDSNALTPTTAKTMAAIFERNTTSNTDAPTLVLRNTGNTTANKILFDYYNGGSTAGECGITYGGDFFIKSLTNNLYVGDYSGPHSIIGPQARFNYQGASNSFFWYRGAGWAYLMYLNGDEGTAYFGSTTSSWYMNPNCTIYAQSKDGNKPALTIGLTAGAPSTGIAWDLRNSSSTQVASLNNAGQLALVTQVANQGHLCIGSANGSAAQIRLLESYSIPSIAGGLVYSSGRFYGGDASNTMRRFLQTPSSYTSGSFGYIDASGDVVADNKIYWNGSYIGASYQILCQGGLGLSSNQHISLGTGSMLMGNIIFNYVAKSANYTLNSGDYAINVTASGKTMTLPTASGKTGQVYVIKATYTSGTGTLNTTSSQTIFTTSAVTSITMNAGDCVRVMSNGSNWIAI